jgi:hypothetical protein
MSVSWFREFSHAVHEAHFRAAITGSRYRVSYDPANRWWGLREGARLDSSYDPAHPDFGNFADGEDDL